MKFITRQRSFCLKKKNLEQKYLLININRKTSGKEYDESQKNTIYRKGTNGRDKKGETGGCSLSPEGTVSLYTQRHSSKHEPTCFIRRCSPFVEALPLTSPLSVNLLHPKLN